VGDESFEPWPNETPLYADESGGLIAQAQSIADEVEAVAQNVRLMTEPFRDQQLSNDLTETARNLARITGMLANGDGAVQRLMTDPETGDEVVATLQNLRTTSSELARTSRSFRQISDEVRTGDGSAHALIYGSDARDAVVNIGRASDELATILGDVRTGDGTVHDLIYEDSADQLLANLTQVSEDAAFLTGEMRAGRGTIGGLLVDPSIYEDVKRLVGDLQRNDILRALVRYSIRRDEAAETPAASEDE
jgi:phospholipid/cholesterol/gamma-HCH transport system substrate-binding protein